MPFNNKKKARGKRQKEAEHEDLPRGLDKSLEMCYNATFENKEAKSFRPKDYNETPLLARKERARLIK